MSSRYWCRRWRTRIWRAQLKLMENCPNRASKIKRMKKNYSIWKVFLFNTLIQLAPSASMGLIIMPILICLRLITRSTECSRLIEMHSRIYCLMVNLKRVFLNWRVKKFRLNCNKKLWKILIIKLSNCALVICRWIAEWAMILVIKKYLTFTIRLKSRKSYKLINITIN